jgi:hypothetical protein
VPGFVRAFDTIDLNFALASARSPSYTFRYVHQPTEGRARLLLYLLHPLVFWCGEAESLAVTFSPKEWQPTAGRPGRWVFHLWA